MYVAILSRSVTSANAAGMQSLLDALESRKVKLCYHEKFFNSISRIPGVRLPEGVVFTSSEDLPEGISLFLSLGGDGTFLSSLTFVRERQIPVAGINFGHLGFLTTAKVEEDDALAWLDDLLEGNYTLDDRDLLKVSVAGIPDGFYPYAVNEVSIQRKGTSMLSIDISIDGMQLPAYWADGLVIATPTGSTAYSLSVGGPIVLPDSKVLIIAPIAPHNLNVRPLVIPAGSKIELCVNPGKGDALVTVDNRSFDICPEQKIEITRGEYGFRYVSLHDNTFIDALKNKLLWGGDKRNI
jgi:Predicted sugar kinase